MTCYLHHLKHIFPELGLVEDKLSRKKIDKAIRTVLGMPDKKCPEVWMEIKSWQIASKEHELIDHVKKLI